GPCGTPPRRARRSTWPAPTSGPMRSPACARRARRPRATRSRSGAAAGRSIPSCAIWWIRSPSPAPTPGAPRRAISRSPRRRATRSTWTTRSCRARAPPPAGAGSASRPRPCGSGPALQATTGPASPTHSRSRASPTPPSPRPSPAAAGGDTAGGFHLPAAFSNQRRLDLAVGVDPRRLGGKLFGDSAALARLLGRLSNLDLSYGRTLLSSYDRVPGSPSLGYQFALGRFDDFKTQSGRLALAATDNSSLNAAANVALPEGMRVNMNYRRTRGVTWALRLDQQVPIRSASTEWPSANVIWSVSPGATGLGRVLASLSAQLGYRNVETASDQPSFLGAEAPAATSARSERSSRPAVAL